VPAGFCLTTQAYRHHLVTSGLCAMIDHLLAQPEVTDGEKADSAWQRGEIGSFLKGEISREGLHEIIPHHRAEYYCYEETKVAPPIIIEAFAEGSRGHLIRICSGDDVGEEPGSGKFALHGLAGSAGESPGEPE
jgi:hypothetical protein